MELWEKNVANTGNICLHLRWSFFARLLNSLSLMANRTVNGRGMRHDLQLTQYILDACDRWEFTPFFKSHRQSPCTALTAGKCLPLGLCKGTVKESTCARNMWRSTSESSWILDIKRDFFLPTWSVFFLSVMHWNGNFVSLAKLSSISAPEVRILITFSGATDDYWRL